MFTNVVEVAMQRYKAQTNLFELIPSRINLLQVKIPELESGKPTIINVWRNHSFEPLEPLISAYANFRSWPLTFRLGNYDDSFSFNGIQSASLELLWMDSNRLSLKINFPEWLEWLQDRLILLRNHSSAPIVLATWVKDDTQRSAIIKCLDKFPAVYFADLSEACETAGVTLLDNRYTSIAGSPISGKAQVVLARMLACKWFAGVLLPPIKAVALDLDETLHKGVLGEDGLDKVELTKGHKNLQLHIKELHKRGIFIALVSRNEIEDVHKLFLNRSDYPLRWDDFSAMEVSWGKKADALDRIAQKLRISTDAILFVDDNIGELAAVTQQLNGIHTLYADSDAELTKSAIEFYPSLWRWNQEADDSKRIIDIKANAERDFLTLTYTDPSEYLQSLEATLTFHIDVKPQLGRLADLCRKTNQFNLSLRRLNEAELFELMNRQDACVASVHLSDRLSDSGIIAVIAAERSGDTLHVIELCISCRAMGRHLESNIILLALRKMSIWKGSKSVEFGVQVSERNQPAIEWLNCLMKDIAISHKDLQTYTAAARSIEEVNLIQGVVIKGD